MCGWNRSAASGRVRSASLLLLLATLLVFPGCSKNHEPATSAARVLRISQRNEPSDLDPATATLPDEFFVIGALSEGLLVPDPAGGPPLPAAAERFDTSADGLTYTFHLRAGARWSDGNPITAADFVDSYRRLLTPATGAPKADLFFAVKNARAFATATLADFSQVGFRASDDLTLVVALEAPTLRFPYYVASGPWIPVNRGAVEKYGRTWTQPGHFVGNGPFALAEWRPQQRIVVKKNPHFRASAGLQLDEIDFVRFDNDEAEEHAFRAGQIDVTVTVPRTKLSVYGRDHPAELQHADTAETRFLSFNTQRAPLNDVRVRRALSLAIDRARLVERVLLGGQKTASRLLPPALRPSGQPALSVEIGYDRTEAQRLIASAGFPGGKGFPRLELASWSSSQTVFLEALQAMWRQELGIEVSLATREAKVLLSSLATGDYDIAFVTSLTLLDVNDPVALLENFTSDGANNFPHWRSPPYDQAVSSARLERDPARQATGLAEAESLLLRESPVAPLYFNARNWLMSQRVHGWQEDALWTRSYLRIRVDP
jgi:oligopeptide transport system substrate-binding protein